MKKFTAKERKLIAIAAGAVGLFLLYRLALTPFLGYCDRIQKDIPRMERDLVRAHVIQAQYGIIDQEIRDIRSRLDARPAEFKPHDFLSTLARKEGILSNLDKIQLEQKEAPAGYEEQIAAVKLKHITLEKLVSYLYGIENSGQMITVKDLSVKPDSGNSLMLEAKFNASTFVKLQKKEAGMEKKPPAKKHRARRS